MGRIQWFGLPEAHHWTDISSPFNDMSPSFQSRSSDVGREVAKIMTLRLAATTMHSDSIT